MKNTPNFILAILMLVCGGLPASAQASFTVTNSLKTIEAADLRDFFSYSKDRIPFISAHRGGPREGFPENCLATFENTLKTTPAILEIDPRYTKDGEIVLMHDVTLDRTTNGTGKVSDYTLAELRKLRLKDTEGNLTPYQIPTLDEALQWAKGKTVLVIDAKDVPMEVRVKKILENGAEANAMVIAYSMKDIQTAYQLSEKIMMEVMVGKMENLKPLDGTGVPWENMVAFIGHDLPVNADIVREVHQRGAMCIQGSSRNYDRQYMRGEISKKELQVGYLDLLKKGVDIIEADLSIESGEAIAPLQQQDSAKGKFFKW